MAKQQTNESRAIKALNQQIIELAKWSNVNENPEIAKVIKAALNTGIEFAEKTSSKGINTLVIRNTRENQKKIDALRSQLSSLKFKTKADLRTETIKELKSEGKKATPQNIKQRLQDKSAINRFESNLDFYYNFIQGSEDSEHLTDFINKHFRNKASKTTEFNNSITEFDRLVNEYRKNERETAYNSILSKDVF